MGVLARHDEPTGRGEGRIVYLPDDTGQEVGDRTQRRQEVMARRRHRFVWLLVVTGISLVLAVIFSGLLWLVFLAGGGVLTAYTLVLRRWKSQTQQAAEVVRTFPGVRGENTSPVRSHDRPHDQRRWHHDDPPMGRNDEARDERAAGEAGLNPAAAVGDTSGLHAAHSFDVDDRLQVVHHPDRPWQPDARVRIRRWG